MAKRSRPTFQKRQKEMARQQRQQDKMARRLAAKETVALETKGEDPDIAGIVPGPQPLPPEFFEAPPRVKPDEP